ncbi:hypothetical protein SAMN04488515_3166 [Cognatiyoonia koreensis]|uniref:Uncharacterized protein n=1 Tax=Cognatiyoonia koreensis TaxID=364200 RepID=A0A1I0RS63_9RHOB|nr:hypothetical protein [Cognatiyoonia koreensis]SEW44186.1 hypothetical protein SAMN04488515_3166 [Cognatiyoonia koreensis]
MSELIEYDVIESAFKSYFDEHAEKFRALFDSLENLSGINECRLIIFPEKIYDQFPAIMIFLGSDNQRVFEDDLPDAVKKALKSISYLPNVVEYEDVDPEATGVARADGQVESVFLVVRELMEMFLAPLVPVNGTAVVTIGLQDEEPSPIGSIA